ncbi:hypothetical protein BJ085DRAFT_4232, partial [Dimargaris cristalligena]
KRRRTVALKKESAVLPKPNKVEEEIPSTPTPEMDSTSGDPASLKRQKNTDAARRSRMRKLLRVESLEAKVVDLETENTTLATKLAYLESEKVQTKETVSTLMEQIRSLEHQLICANQALT